MTCFQLEGYNHLNDFLSEAMEARDSETKSSKLLKENLSIPNSIFSEHPSKIMTRPSSIFVGFSVLELNHIEFN